MLQKIKDMGNMSAALKALTTAFSEHVTVMEKHTDKVNALGEAITSLEKSQTQLKTQLSQDRDDMSELREEFRKEITDFKLIKSRLEKKLSEKIDSEFQEALLPHFEKLEKHTSQFGDVQNNLSSVSKRVEQMSSRLDTFLEISSQIKTADFELDKHAKNLKIAESEKQHLLSKIDKLETLISKMRRTR